MKNKCQRPQPPPFASSSASPAAGPACVYPGQDELLATARSSARVLTSDPYSTGQESSPSFVNPVTVISLPTTYTMTTVQQILHF